MNLLIGSRIQAGWYGGVVHCIPRSRSEVPPWSVVHRALGAPGMPAPLQVGEPQWVLVVVEPTTSPIRLARAQVGVAYIMPISICTYWIRFKNTLVKTSKWLRIIPMNERSRSLNKHQYHIDVLHQGECVHVHEGWLLLPLSESTMRRG